LLILNHDQRGLVDYLSERVRDLVATARETTGNALIDLLAEAEELSAIRAGIVGRNRDSKTAAQMQLPLELEESDLKVAA
jgi:hypothetical protein